MTYASATVESDIEITEGMICAAAEVLLADPFLGLGPSGAEELAEEILARALSAHREKTSANGP
jgi:hypothetical protein